MEHSEAYLVLSLFIQHRLLVIRYVELLNLLDTLHVQERITLEEAHDLLSLGEHLKNYDLPINE